MTTKQLAGELSRRGFLNSVGAAAVAGGVAAAFPSFAAESQLTTSSTIDQATPLDLGLMASLNSAGGTVFDTPRGKCLTFKALWLDGERDFSYAGTAVFELRGCVATRFRYPGGEPTAADAHLADVLDLCRTYEVKNSSWLERVERTLPPQLRPAKRGAGGFRHFAFTFVPNSFECIVEDLTVSVRAEPFSQILTSLLQGD